MFYSYEGQKQLHKLNFFITTKKTDMGLTKRYFFTMLVVFISITLSNCDNSITEASDALGVIGAKNDNETFEGSTQPSRTEEAPYPAVEPVIDPTYTPNKDHLRYPPVPIGPIIGNMEPANPPVKIEAFDPSVSQEIEFDIYEDVDDDLPRVSTLGEVSVAEAPGIIMMTGNTWMAYSENGGNSFNYINPTTLFPQDDNGLCCDQIVLYEAEFNIFIWLMQYRSTTAEDGTRDNRIRIAVQSPEGLQSSNGTAWTYWDFLSNTFSSSGSLDYNDMTTTSRSLYWNSMINGGRVVVRIPLSELAARSTVNFRYTPGTQAVFSHITQNASNQVFWAGHESTSQLRIYNWPDGDNSYYWRTININSWPNGSESSITPDGVDWMQWETNITTYIYGNALQGSDVWFAWQAGAGGGFDQPHVQMVRVDASNFSFKEQVQIWNPDFAFQDAFLSTNSDRGENSGELGISIGFGGGLFHGSHAVGVWGDFVVYYPTLSDISLTRWGDYNTSRRSSTDPRRWVAGGYTLKTNGSGNAVSVPHYIRFGR